SIRTYYPSPRESFYRGSVVERREKMLVFGGTGVLLTGAASRYMQSYGGDTMSGTGLFTWVTLRMRGQKLMFVSVYVPNKSKRKNAVFVRARRKLQQNPIEWMKRKINEAIRAD